MGDLLETYNNNIMLEIKVFPRHQSILGSSVASVIDISKLHSHIRIREESLDSLELRRIDEVMDQIMLKLSWNNYLKSAT